MKTLNYVSRFSKITGFISATIFVAFVILLALQQSAIILLVISYWPALLIISIIYVLSVLFTDYLNDKFLSPSHYY